MSFIYNYRPTSYVFHGLKRNLKINIRKQQHKYATKQKHAHRSFIYLFCQPVCNNPLGL